MRAKGDWILLAAVVALLAMGCASSGPQPQQTTDIFADEKDGILTVRNETGTDIVLFAGNVKNRIVLGGIRANSARNFYIAKIENIPEKGTFIVRGVSAEAYYQKPLLVSGDVLFSGLVVYDLQDTGNITKVIPKEIDETGSFGIYVSNNSRTICELRLDAPDGPAIAVLSPYVRNWAVWIKPSEFGRPREIWPIFISVSPDGIINESVPSNYDRARFIPELRGGRISMFEFDNRADENARINLLFE